jgi:hypothetical protein
MTATQTANSDQADDVSADSPSGDPAPELPLFENQSPTPASSRAADTDDLAKLASAINDCLLKVDDHLSKAEDNRLKAARHLAEANKACKAAGITFKDWCNSKIKITYDEARKLAKVGESPDPANAMADMRKRNAILNKSARAKTVSRDTAAAARKCSPEEAALAAEFPPGDKHAAVLDANNIFGQVKEILVNTVPDLSGDQAAKLFKQLRDLIDEFLEEHGKAQGSLQIDKSANSNDLPIPPFIRRNRKDGEA